MHRLLAVILFFFTTMTASESPWAAYRFAPDASVEIDLAGDTGWTLAIDDGAKRTIKVPAGGWNSDRQDPQIANQAVDDHVTYERTLDIPASAKDQAVKLHVGGCNFGAEVWIGERKIMTHHAPMTPFTADLTGVVQPGKSCLLRVIAYNRKHFIVHRPDVPRGFDYELDSFGVMKNYNGCSKYAYGLTGYVRLAVYPQVHISDVYVRPSVSNVNLAYDVEISNASAQAHTVALGSTFASWGASKNWKYPAVPARTVTIPAHASTTVTIEGVPWKLGRESWWWPNIPYRPDYVATLHLLKLSLTEGGRAGHQAQRRFGFCEHGEGPFYYTINGVRYQSISDSLSYGQIGEYDCWTETACFQPPHGTVKGCPETWARYQRIGFNTWRLSTSVPTAYMLESADEAGFMLIPEGGSWGNGYSDFDAGTFAVQLQVTIRAVRNHPCVARYSLANESIGKDYESPDNLWRGLIDAAMEVDPTRPYVFEIYGGQPSAVVKGLKKGHANCMEHYTTDFQPASERLRGLGECWWEKGATTDSMPKYAMEAIRLRLNDWTHFAPWSWINYWPNFLEGMNTNRHPWKVNNYGDRVDGVNGWNSPMVSTVQRSLHPFLIVDTAQLAADPWLHEDSKAATIAWPYTIPVLPAGQALNRPFEVFNGGLIDCEFTLRWSATWDQPNGPVAVAPTSSPATPIKAGFHASIPVRFTSPTPGQPSRTLCLRVESLTKGAVVYTEDRLRFTVSAP